MRRGMVVVALSCPGLAVTARMPFYSRSVEGTLLRVGPFVLGLTYSRLEDA